MATRLRQHRVTKSGDLMATRKMPLAPRPRVLSRSSIIASPVFADGRVFVAMGQSPGHGNGPSLLHAISPYGQGDVTESGRLWTSREVGRVVGTPIVKDGLLYVGDLGGTVHCLDATTGAHLWKHETNDAIWGSSCWLATAFTLGTRRPHDRSSCRAAKGIAGAD